jgi:hypothetical protein
VPPWAGPLGDGTATVARAFQSDHEQHRALLTEEIVARGGTPVVAVDAGDDAEEHRPLATAADIVAYAVEREAGATRASAASVAHDDDRQPALLAAQIGGVEAQRWATLLGATGAHPGPSPVIELDAA